MRKLLYILGIILLSAACEKDSKQNLYCLATLEITVQGQDSAPVSVIADQSLSGTMFRNINTLEDYSIPVIAGGMAQIQVLKGLYMIAFDADAIFADGTSHRVRSAQFNSPEKAVRLTEDNCRITLNLTVLP